jgi:hypothetical protein
MEHIGTQLSTTFVGTTAHNFHRNNNFVISANFQHIGLVTQSQSTPSVSKEVSTKLLGVTTPFGSSCCCRQMSSRMVLLKLGQHNIMAFLVPAQVGC